MKIQFEYPYLLVLLLLLPAFIYFYFFILPKYRQVTRYSNIDLLKNLPRSWRMNFLHVPFFLRLFSFLFIILLLAGPFQGKKKKNVHREGIDIMICLDVSGSMLFEDMSPNRLEVAKKEIVNFIKKRRADRIGLMAFSGQAYLLCPLTLDHNLLISLLEKVKYREDIEQGTAIGTVTGRAVFYLKESKAKTKLILLTTDGENNVGDITPMTAAKIAKMKKIKIYSIGIGKPGESQVPITRNVTDVFGNKSTRRMLATSRMDEETLKKMSKESGGKYFNAQDQKQMQNTYSQINKLEKSKIKGKFYFEKKYLHQKFLTIILMLFVLEIFINNFILRRTEF